jgi:alkanesulfonate monooxygenase SsuD/methylene tetrahydromethanopterin reductase-like flavin-dependent oxidoreductase (luciferase family)
MMRVGIGLPTNLGARPTDYEALGAPFARRGRRFEAQLETMIGIWTASAEAEGEDEGSGPAPVQTPHPPL